MLAYYALHAFILEGLCRSLCALILGYTTVCAHP